MKEIETENLIIRKPKMEDAEQGYKNIASEKELMECLNARAHQNIEETKRFIQSAIAEFEVNEPSWAIESKEENEIIGYITLRGISRENKRCNLFFAMGFKWWEERYLEEALEELTRYLLTEEGFDIIICNFYDCSEMTTNFKSKVLESIGMKKEAVLRNRKTNRTTGEKQDLIVYSITKEDCKKKIAIRTKIW